MNNIRLIRTLVVSVVACLGLSACQRAATDKDSAHPSLELEVPTEAPAPVIASVSPQDEGMSQVLRLGAESFNEGLRLWSELGPDVPSGMRVKVRFEGPQQQGEYMWVGLQGFAEGSFDGVLLNTPVVAAQLRQGEEVQVRSDQVVDWAVEVEGQPTRGELSTCYLALKSNPDESAASSIEKRPADCDWAKAFFQRKGFAP